MIVLSALSGPSSGAWVIDDICFPKKGKHSVGVARQYGGQWGRQENCQLAVSLSLATWKSSLPIAYRLYLPPSWAGDRQRLRQAGVPEEVLPENTRAGLTALLNRNERFES